jgi:hypothetical protein
MSKIIALIIVIPALGCGDEITEESEGWKKILYLCRRIAADPTSLPAHRAKDFFAIFASK